MAETKYQPVRHNHKAFLRKAKRHSGFQQAYQALAAEYEVAGEMPASHAQAVLITNLNKQDESDVKRFQRRPDR